MLAIQHLFSELDDTKSVLSGIEEGITEQLIAGLSGSARTVFLASIYKNYMMI
jgi:transcription-repair coupling factor (superfamily II helicase)